MIITCPNCNKQFKIDNSLIPDEGRDLQCGSCNHIWFYNIQEKNNEVLELKQEIISEDIETKAENKEDKIEEKQQPEEEAAGRSPSRLCAARWAQGRRQGRQARRGWRRQRRR